MVTVHRGGDEDQKRVPKVSAHDAALQQHSSKGHWGLGFLRCNDESNWHPRSILESHKSRGMDSSLSTIITSGPWGC
eukprot:2339235-Amphidinium_carterae.3